MWISLRRVCIIELAGCILLITRVQLLALISQMLTQISHLIGILAGVWLTLFEPKFCQQVITLIESPYCTRIHTTLLHCDRMANHQLRKSILFNSAVILIKMATTTSKLLVCPAEKRTTGCSGTFKKCYVNDFTNTLEHDYHTVLFEASLKIVGGVGCHLKQANIHQLW